MATAAFMRGQVIAGSDQRRHNIGTGHVKVSVKKQTEVSLIRPKKMFFFTSK